MKKILLISNYRANVGGISGQVELLKYYLSNEGFEVEIFNTKGSLWYRLGLFYRLRKVGKLYDVFHIHACSKLGFLPAIVGIKVGKKLQKKIVLTYHGGGAATFFKKHIRLVRKYLLQTDSNIVLSGFLGNIFQQYDIPYVIIPNIIKFKDQYKERDIIHPNFISIRSLTSLYNIECILRAFEIVKKRITNATLMIVGDGCSRLELEQYVEAHQLEDVTFVGKVKNSDIYHFLDQSDIMLSSPREDNMPVSLLEGMNAGLLVISSNVGGVPYMIEDHKNGLLFESDNDKMLSEKMIWAVTHQDDVKLMMKEGSHFVKDYKWESVRNKILAQYV